MLGDRLKLARSNKGISQAKLAEEAGMSQQTIAKIESNQALGTKFILQLARALDISPEWLQFGTGQIKEPAMAYQLTAFPKGVSAIPIISWNQVIEWCEQGTIELDEHTEFVPALKPCNICSFALKVQNDAMIGEKDAFHEGEIILIDPRREAVSGNYVIVLMADESEPTFRKLVRDGSKQYLKALNSDYPTVFLSDDAKILGVAVGRMAILV